MFDKILKLAQKDSIFRKNLIRKLSAHNPMKPPLRYRDEATERRDRDIREREETRKEIERERKERERNQNKTARIKLSKLPPSIFNEFFDQKYDGGKKMVRNPNPKGRKEEVSASTAMKDKRFQKQVWEEFQKWRKKKKEKKEEKSRFLSHEEVKKHKKQMRDEFGV